MELFYPPQPVKIKLPKLPKSPLAVKARRPLVDEAERLEALHSYHILDTEPEQVFNDLAQLATLICGTPMSMVSLADSERQWFKAKVGLSTDHAPRETVFCQQAMETGELYEIPDARADERFAENPLVTGFPHIRFYVGAPLLTPDGLPIGTLCALDTVPRRLSSDQRAAVRILARQVMTHLELRRTRLQLEDERQRMNGVLRLAQGSGEAGLANNRTEVFVKQDQRLVRVATADLHYVEALGDYVNLYTTRERLTVYGTMKDLETKLPGRDFARVHRKYIVRLDCIVAIEGDAAVLDGVRETGPNRGAVRVPIGSSYKPGLLSRLNVV